MKYLAYWPFGIALAWVGASALSLAHYGAPPAIRALTLVALPFVLLLGAANARWVARHRAAERRQLVALATRLRTLDAYGPMSGARVVRPAIPEQRPDSAA